MPVCAAVLSSISFRSVQTAFSVQRHSSSVSSARESIRGQKIDAIAEELALSGCENRWLPSLSSSPLFEGQRFDASADSSSHRQTIGASLLSIVSEGPNHSLRTSRLYDFHTITVLV